MLKVRERKNKKTGQSFSPKRWEADFVIEFPDGTKSARQRPKLPDHIITEAAAWDYARQLADNYYKTGGISKTNTLQTVKQIQESLVAATKRVALRERIINTYNRYLIHLANKPITHITKAEWIAINNEIENAVIKNHKCETKNNNPIKPSSQNNVKTAVRNIINHAEKLGFNMGNAQALLPPNKLGRVRYAEKAYTKEEFSKLSEAARDPRYQILLLLGAVCGLRRSEIACIDTSKLEKDVNGNYLVRVNEHYASDNGKILPGTKSSTTGHVAYISVQNYARLQNLFEQIGNKKLGYQRMSYYLRAMCSETGIPYRGVHALRHSAATLQIQSGVPIHIVAEQLGHASVEMTMKYIDKGAHLAATAVSQFQNTLFK